MDTREMKKYQKEYYHKHKEKFKLRYTENKEKLKQKYIENKTKIKQKYLDNKEEILKKAKEYNLRNKETIKKYQKEYREKNKEKIKAYADKHKKRIINKEDREKRKEKNRKRYKERYSNDSQFKLKRILRRRLGKVLKERKIIKSKNTLELLGCSLDFLKKHIESQFKEGMTWENHGQYGWHIDHIIPCSSFDLTDPEQQKKCFNCKNLQPLWWHENLSKNKNYQLI